MIWGNFFVWSVLMSNGFDLIEYLRKRDIDGVKQLITHENVNDNWYHKENAIWIVCLYGCDREDASLLRYFLEKYPHASTRRLLHLAAYNDKPNMIRELIQLGVNIDERNCAGHTALHSAVCPRHRSQQCARLLLDAGAAYDPHSSFCDYCRPDTLHFPNWLTEFVETRNATRKAATVVLGLYRCCRRRGTNKDVLRIVARCVWSTRGHHKIK